MYLVLLLYALFASVFTIGKTGLQHAEPLFLVGTRMMAARVIMLAYQFYFHRDQFKINNSFWKLLRLAAFNIYLTNVFEFWGLKYLTSFKTCFIYSLSPFLSALFSYFIFTERMSMKKWLGLLIGFGGLLPILMNESTGEEQLGHIFFLSWAEIAVLGAAVSSVYGWILLKQVVKENGVAPFMANGISMFFGGGMALLQSYFMETWDPIPVTDYIPFSLNALFFLLSFQILFVITYMEHY